MELKAVSRHMELGVIPNNWTVAALGDLLALQNGVNADKSSYGSGIPFINVLEVITHPTLTSAKIPGRIKLSAAIIDSFKVQRGDVLFNRTSETQEEVGLASVYLDDKEVVFGGFVIRGRLRNSQLCPEFAVFSLRAPAVRKQIVARGQGVVRANIGQKELSKVLILIPPIAEQEAIAEALTDADALIESLEQLIAKKRLLKQGAMQELLRARPNWCRKKLADVAPLQRGFDLPSRHLKNGPYPVVYSNGILAYHDRYQVKSPGLVTGRSGTLGVVQFIENDFWPHNTTLWVTDFKGNDPKFVHALYSHIGFQRFGTGSGVPTLNRNDAHSFLASIPNKLSEQTAIATILTDMDAEITALESKLAKARQIKQGMMHNLLTGKIRLG